MKVGEDRPHESSDADQKPKWKEFKTKEGKPYYYDSVSKKTQWTRPAEMDDDAETAPPKVTRRACAPHVLSTCSRAV